MFIELYLVFVICFFVYWGYKLSRTELIVHVRKYHPAPNAQADRPAKAGERGES